MAAHVKRIIKDNYINVADFCARIIYISDSLLLSTAVLLEDDAGQCPHLSSFRTFSFLSDEKTINFLDVCHRRMTSEKVNKPCPL